MGKVLTAEQIKNLKEGDVIISIRGEGKMLRKEFSNARWSVKGGALGTYLIKLDRPFMLPLPIEMLEEFINEFGIKFIMQNNETPQKETPQKETDYKENTAEVLKGWEVVRLLAEEKESLEGKEIVCMNEIGKEFTRIFVKNRTLFRKDGNTLSTIPHYILSSFTDKDNRFVITESKSYITFEEARSKGKLVKHKNWSEFISAKEAVNTIYDTADKMYNEAVENKECAVFSKIMTKLLDEKVWEYKNE